MDITGATSPTLTINPPTGGDAGEYRVRVVNACGSVESSVAVLNVETTVCNPPPTGMTTWWPAEGNANDLVGGDHGLPENGPDFVSGRVGQAFSFAGDDRIRFNSMFELHQPRDASIEFWLKFNPSTHQCLFWTRPDDADANRFNISINGDSILQVDYRAPSGALHLPGFGAPVPANTWSHVAIVRAENVYTIFVNGSAAASRVDASPDLPNTIGWQLSGRGGFHVVAELDELSSYNRALTPA